MYHVIYYSFEREVRVRIVVYEIYSDPVIVKILHIHTWRKAVKIMTQLHVHVIVYIHVNEYTCH